MTSKKITLNEFRSFVKKTMMEDNYLSGISNPLIDEDWDTLYNKAHKEPTKSKIKKALYKIFKDKSVMIRVADNYLWTDRSNGFINFSNLNHFITDIGFMSYADNPDLLNNLDDFKEHILHSYASAGNELRRGEKYTNFEYKPNDEFSW